MAFASLAPIVIGDMDDEVARVERRRELPQRIFFSRAVWSFEQDDRTAAVRYLWQLKLAQMVPKG
jgi:hypothetical protein